MSDNHISIFVLLSVLFSVYSALEIIPIDDEDDDDDDNSTNVCDLPIDEGDCSSESLSESDYENGTVTVYGYNSNTTKCEQFIYEGCDGNRNRFENGNDCWKACYTPLRYFLARVTHVLSAQ